jgi:hypothetical protein
MSRAPIISVRDLEQELDAIFAAPHRSNKAAVYGRLELLPPSVQATVDGAPKHFKVAGARCELELRKALGASGDEPLVVVVDYGLDVPLDVQSRLAKGRVVQVTPERRLARRFAAREVSPEVLRVKPLVDALLEDGESFGQVRGPRLDLDFAWRELLSRWSTFPSEGSITEEQVVAFAASGAGAAEFVRRAASREGLLEALHAWLERVAGPIARLAWSAWERDEGEQVAALAFLLDATAERVGANGYLRARLKALFESLAPEAGAWVGSPERLLRWGALASRLSLRLEPRAMTAILAKAERLLPDAELENELAHSRHLPRAFEAMKARLARALEEAVKEPGRESFEQARKAYDELREHRLAQEEARATLLRRALMALRLLGWRLARPDSSPTHIAASYEEMLQLAEDYVAQGAFADFGRSAARGSSAEPLGAAIEKVVGASDALRDEDDRRFAHGLMAWVMAGRHSDRVVPIEEALTRFGSALLEKDYRRLLVLVLDGMSWANAVELLLALEPRQFGPIRWRPSKAQGRALLQPVIAALPTTTEVSRAALFAGRLPKPGEVLDTTRDPDRFAAHRELSKRCGGVPRLLLRGEATTAGGDASREALQAIGSSERVVGIVVNAIDDQLKAGSQVRLSFGPETIRPIQDLLEAAAQAGRAVLLVSDHGHVPGSRLEPLSAGPAQGSRWRVLPEGEQPGEREIDLGGDHVWKPRGKDRIALLFGETDSYGARGVHGGEHGGASLAETIVPAVLIASERLAAGCTPDGTIDAELEVTSLPRPEWWDLELPKAPARKPRPKAEPAPQKTMPFAQPLSQPEPAPAPEPSPLRAMLAASPVFKELMKARRGVPAAEILRQVELLADHGGRMTPELFAARAGMLPFRVAGAVARLAEILNLDGYAVVTLDPIEKQIRLDLELLTQLFKGS